MTPYYQDESVTIWHGDCREVLASLEPVDHVITDPPYEAEAHNLGRRAFSGKSSAEHPKGIAEDRPLDFSAITDDDRRVTGSLMAVLSRGWLQPELRLRKVPAKVRKTRKRRRERSKLIVEVRVPLHLIL